MKSSNQLVLLLLLFGMVSCQNNEMPVEEAPSVPVLKALIIDGQSSHGIWPKTTMMMKDFLEQTGLFEVEIYRTEYVWLGPHYDKSIGLDSIEMLLDMYPLEGVTSTIVKQSQADPNFSPDFNQYDVVISNFGARAAHWPDSTKRNFETYMAEGGGLVVVHGANNAWGDWPEYNQMIAIGGWGERNENSGPFLYYDEEGKLHRDMTAGKAGSHGPQYEFVLDTRAPEHPIMKGLPSAWLHTKDELYDRLRGPAENVTVLATAYSDVEKNSPPWNKNVSGTGRHEPQLLAIEYGKGRVFHTVLGHMVYSMECVGFMTSFQRGAEWAATGKVTQAVPKNFPTAEASSRVAWGQ